MRLLLSIIALSVTSAALPLSAQPYLPLVKENRFWVYTRMEIAEFPVHITQAFALSFQGDTTIQGLSWQKLVWRSLKISPDAKSVSYPYEVISPAYLYGYFREDSLARKVFYRPIADIASACSPEEHLLYDFSLQEGDTLNECVLEKIYAPDFCIIPNIDSIRLEMRQGKMRRAFYTVGSFQYVGLPFCGPGVLDEGFGYEQYGLFNFGGPSHETPYTPLIDYCEGTLQTCGFVSSSGDLNSREAEISVSPNPADDKILLKHSAGICKGTFPVKIFDLSGKTRTTSVIDACETSTLNIQHLPEGIYFLQILNSGRPVSAKLLVQRR